MRHYKCHAVPRNKRLLKQTKTANGLSLPAKGELSYTDSDAKMTKETGAFWDDTV